LQIKPIDKAIDRAIDGFSLSLWLSILAAVVIFFVVILLLVFPDTGFGQQEKGDLPKRQIHLSIEEALKLAFKNNRDLKTAQRTLLSAESSYRVAKASCSPKLSGDISTSYSVYNQINMDPSVENTYRGGVEVNFSLPLDLSGSIDRSLQQASISLSSSKANYITTCQNLVVSVCEQYYDLIRLQETITIDQAQVKMAEEQLRIAKARVEKGRAPEVDVMTATVQLNNAKQSLKRDERDYLNALAALLNTLVLDHGLEIVPTTELKYVPETFTYEEAEKEALKSRPEMEIARLRLESARIALKSTSDPYRPTWSLSAGWGYQVSGTRVSEAIDQRPDEPSWSVTTSLNLPLFIFDGGVIRESKTQAMIDLEQAEADIKETIDSIKLEIKRELTNFENAQERVQIAEDNIKLAKETLKITELRYTLGSSSYLELVDARNNLRTAELNLLDALIAHTLSKIRVHKALGRSMVTATGQLIKDN